MNDRPIHHVCYIVDDIPTAVDQWIEATGVGPFSHLGSRRLSPALRFPSPGAGSCGRMDLQAQLIRLTPTPTSTWRWPPTTCWRRWPTAPATPIPPRWPAPRRARRELPLPVRGLVNTQRTDEELSKIGPG